jgi:tRNA nucleotidyltransferase (CCA-adding enzyme)
MIDDESPGNKVKGCRLLQMVLSKTSNQLLTRTGLGEVFAEALVPCLAFHPPLVTEDEAVVLLDPVFSTLLILCKARFPNTNQRKQELAMLDKLLRTGVFGGLTYGEEHPKLAILLLEKASVIIDKMGIYFIKHLKVCS